MTPKVAVSSFDLRGGRLLDVVLLAVVVLPSAIAHSIAAQELTPRAYWPAPRGPGCWSSATPTRPAT